MIFQNLNSKLFLLMLKYSFTRPKFIFETVISEICTAKYHFNCFSWIIKSVTMHSNDSTHAVIVPFEEILSRNIFPRFCLLWRTWGNKQFYCYFIRVSIALFSDCENLLCYLKNAQPHNSENTNQLSSIYWISHA